jgi:hydroxymethylglutaryl-CoA synthase
VHNFCELPSTCRAVELKHACYGGTGALKLAASWVASGARPGKKALVVSSDFTRSHERSHFDAVGGGVAVAMIVGQDGAILGLEPSRAGYFTQDIADACRPTARMEVIDNEISLFSYLDALDGAYDSFEANVGGCDLLGDYRKHIYHAPFPGMTFHAHRSLLDRVGIRDEDAVQDSFAARVAEGLCFARRIGTAYGASNFVSLLGLLTSASDLRAGDRVSIFSYGSGCQGEFYDATIGPAASDLVHGLGLGAHIDARMPITVADFDHLEAVRDARSEVADYTVDIDVTPGAYNTLYRGRKLLVLESVQAYRRHYRFS